MSCAVFIVSCFQYSPSCFYLLILLFLTRMHSLNSLCGWKSFSESFPVFRSASKLLSRADAFRRRAIELAMQAKREDDPGQRRFLIDKARNLVNVADALDPQPPDEPESIPSFG
jgi:hypothetical protein